MPVGRHPKQNEDYVMQTCDLKEGDMIYFCSDGIQDQIGGPLEQKFMTKRLQKMLGDIAPLDLSEQYQTALKTITEWKASQEQFDDQTLIGLRI
jgi:serine phosphatase RsbU (regulator of sigma subunit)